MHSGGVTRDMATWCLLIGGICCATLGFPTVFQFLGLKSFIFPNSSIIFVTELFTFFLFFLVCLCYYFNFAPAAVLCVSSVCAEHFEGTFSFASIRFFFFTICLQISYLSLSFSLFCFVCCLLCGFLGFKPFPFIFLWFVMVSGSEVRVICPSVSFFFARLRVALGVSGNFLPLVGDFVFAGCGLSVVIGELSPILG